MDQIERIHDLDKIGTQFVQFIIAINGTLIAYAFKQIEDKKLSFDLIPLGIAIIFWGLSFYFGISSIRKLISTRIIGIFRSTSDILNQDPNNKELSKKLFKKLVDTANSYNKKMYIFLYLGGCSYIFWQIIEMYLRTKS